MDLTRRLSNFATGMRKALRSGPAVPVAGARRPKVHRSSFPSDLDERLIPMHPAAGIAGTFLAAAPEDEPGTC